jgi:dTDP-4-amino-4,6-dideoxygalactose transaminase
METKKNINDLAIFDGSKAFNEKLHVGRPNIGDRKHLLERINDILDNRWLTNEGPYVQEFEQKIAELVGAKHCVSVCNATIGLEIAIRALGLSGEVIVPSMTFIATAHALEWQKITPVFCDIDAKTWNIDPDKIEQLITPNTTGIIGVHLFGRPCNTEALKKIASKNNLKLLYDAAHAFGCTYGGKMIGNFGDAEVFSFHATKFFNSLEGGAIVTNNDKLAEKMKLMRNFGFHEHEVISLGINGKMNEFSAAMGITSLESIDEIIEKNRQNYNQYQKELSDVPGVNLIEYDKNEKCNFQYVVLDLDEKMTKISRNDLLKILWAENVIARNYFSPGCHKGEPYRSDSRYEKLHLPITEKIADSLLSLPTGTNMDDLKISKLRSILKFCISNGAEITAKLSNIKQ